MGFHITTVRSRSPTINSIAHNGSTLSVFLKNGERWNYYNVPNHVYQEFRNAENVGGYYRDHIEGVYKGEMI